MTSARTPETERGWFESLPGLLDFLLLLVGVWLLVGHLFIGYSFTEATLDAQLNDSLVGIGVVFASAAQLRLPLHRWFLNAINLVLGGWLILAPFAVGYGFAEGGRRVLINDVVCGALIVVFAATSMIVAATVRSRLIKAERAAAEQHG